MLRVIIAGSRSIVQYEFVKKIIRSAPFCDEITEIVSGTANGVDKLGERYAEEYNIPVKRFPADWGLGKQAGYLRNKQMADYADAAILIHKEGSRGTQHMKDLAEEKGLKIHYVEVRDKETFSLQQLKDLATQTKNMDMIGGTLFNRVLTQYLKQLEEYQTIVSDCRTMIEALKTCDVDYCGPNESKCQIYEYKLVEKALNTQTAKLLQSLNANNKQNSNSL